MPLEESIFAIPGFELEDISGWDPVVFKARYNVPARCPFCSAKELRTKDTFYRKIRHISLGSRRSCLYLRTHKYYCKICKKYFNDRFPGILPYRRSTEAFRKEVFEKHRDGICQSVLSERLRMGEATVERWYQDHLGLRVSERENSPCPRVLGIDEHFFTRKEGYATTLCDLGKHRVYDIALGRSEASLSRYLHSLPDKDKVRVVVIDLSETYRNIIHRYFPKAKTVTDRFHVIRLVNHHFLKTWQLIDPEGRKNRGLLSLMRRHGFNLKERQRERLNDYFTRFPALRAVWAFKERLMKLLLIKGMNHKVCRKLIPVFLRYLQELKYSPFESLSTLGKTLESWSKEIVRMWRFTKSNGITEGFHNKMEMIKRRAYGFRNFENYRLRVRALCA